MGSTCSRFSDPMVMGVVLIQPFSHDSHAAHITVEVGKSSDLASSGEGTVHHRLTHILLRYVATTSKTTHACLMTRATTRVW